MRHTKRCLAGLAGCGLGIVVVLAISGSTDALWHNSDEEVAHTVEHEPNDASGPPDCGISLSSSPVKQSDRFSVRVVVAVDNAWLDDDKSAALTGARDLFRDLTLVFGEFGIQLRAVRLETWSSSSDHLSSSDRLEEAKAAVALADDDIVLALTGRRSSRADGKATIGGRYALIFRHSGHPERDLWVAAHEIGHLFGARHSERSDDDKDVMSPNGFGPEIRWSPCHVSLVRMNANRFDHSIQLATEGSERFVPGD